MADPAAGDLRLGTGSPAIDKYSPTLAAATDFDGLPRPQGSALDIGAFDAADPSLIFFDGYESDTAVPQYDGHETRPAD